MSPSRAPGPGTWGELADIVARYVRDVRELACQRLAFYAEQPSLAQALEVVATWRDHEGKWERHQRRLPRLAREAASERILRLELGDALTFEEIFRRVDASIGAIPRVGALAVYDVALRLAAVLGLPPTRIYLQRSAFAGARALGIRTHERSVPREAFPPELHRLHAWEIHNLLCCFSGELAAAARRLTAA